MAGKLQQPRHQVAELGQAGIGGVEPGFGEALFGHAIRKAAPDGAGQPLRHVLAEPQHAADFAHGAARAIMDDGRRDRRAFAGVAAIDILHHLLAPLVLEIHVDVGGLAAFFGHEARKQQVVFQRIDRGHAQQVADDRIGRRPAPLTQDRRGAAAREPHHVMHRQKIIGIMLAPNEIELFVQQGEDTVGNAIPVTVERILPDEMFQPGLRVPSRRHRLVRIFVSQLIEREADASQQAKAFVDRLRRVAEQPTHLGFVLQMTLAIGGEATSGRIDRHAFADAGDDVVQGPVVTMRIERVRRRQQRHADRLGQDF
ncbi:hypothetical protein WR25_22101 [Diploscapter pachys]|uniref:Uncharacterized protein n=1 Tax=Diploscapter pachys TaxID=2018661 RepID=A0A2A2K6N5_9BILA|nr:hypothetical protein WR25_22101 [Diploscapter pachys]